MPDCGKGHIFPERCTNPECSQRASVTTPKVTGMPIRPGAHVNVSLPSALPPPGERSHGERDDPAWRREVMGAPAPKRIGDPADGQTLRSARFALGVSLRQLADEACLPHVRIGEIERGLGWESWRERERVSWALVRLAARQAPPRRSSEDILRQQAERRYDGPHDVG